MNTEPLPRAARPMIRDLLFHPDPDRRRVAAETLGGNFLRVVDEGDALEALTTAMRDSNPRVQETALQSLVRISGK
ncbi:MAG: HEAT repeat domain-containing protein [Nitrospinae bacterium]|nr:HEAT repeat domain-containing protein [Nitrospinota bacterium]